jgi:hypothetical protein
MQPGLGLHLVNMPDTARELLEYAQPQIEIERRGQAFVQRTDGLQGGTPKEYCGLADEASCLEGGEADIWRARGVRLDHFPLGVDVFTLTVDHDRIGMSRKEIHGPSNGTWGVKIV